MTTLNQAVRSLNVRRGVENALNNELKTRERVGRSESRLNTLEQRFDAHEKGVANFVFGLTFRGRLRWLLSGKVDK